jgi:glucose-1-phosphate thymidylyltransferase
LDTGTHESLTEATEFVKAIEKRTGLKIACIEEIAFKLNWIDRTSMLNIVMKYGNSTYANYVKKLIDIK